jgi:hypothetical protein
MTQARRRALTIRLDIGFFPSKLTAPRRNDFLTGLGARLLLVLLSLASPDEEADADVDVLTRYYPAPVDGPALRLPISPTRLYVDATYARSDDLSALPYVAGEGSNIRFAAGGSLRWRQFAFSAEVPLTQITTLTVTAIPGGAPIPEDAHQTAVSFGDIRLGADWTQHLGRPSLPLVAGFGLRGYVPTHTTRFQFHLVDGSIGVYSFPYFFHLEPTLILGGAFGRFMFAINQGAIVLAGPDGDFGGVPIQQPTVAFWDAHYAVSYAPADVFAASVEVATDIQLNHVSGIDFQRLNGVRSVWVAPGLQLHLGDWRVDAIARLGLTRGADLFGVIEYAGASSYTLRVTRTFN